MPTWRCPRRNACSTPASSTPLAAGGSLSVSVTGVAPLPAPGTVVAAVLNLTVTAPAGTGYWTVWPHTSARPEASNLNVDEQQALAGGAPCRTW